MKIGIITFHFVNNYGGVLQAYALQKFLIGLGYNVGIIDYRNSFIRFTDTIRLFPITKRISVLKSGLKTIPKRVNRVKKINRFIREKLKLTHRYNRIRMIKCSPQFDKYICGSDQIWNPFLTAGIDPVYYLSFVKRRKDRIAYAPSMGTDCIPQFLLRKMMTLISRIKYLSVREQTGAQNVERYTGRKTNTFIDPTLLLEQEDYNKYAQMPEGLPDNYILLYMMQGDKRIYEFGKRMKEQYNLPVVEISRYGFNPGFADHVLVDVGIEEFLGLFMNASFVCTNSYHGLIFSLVYKKPICLIPSVHFSARIRNLLNTLEIPISSLSTYDRLLMDFSYDRVQSKIESERRRSIRFLRHAIGGDT